MKRETISGIIIAPLIGQHRGLAQIILGHITKTMLVHPL
jgi:hypothetical protein